VSTQIAIRLPDETVAFLDRVVASGKAPSRAALVTSALEREMRRQLAEHDAAVLRRQGSADDLDELVVWTAGRLEIDD
jgi:Arc/MetJ-type ribon-helix-helix transcriptional regulator